MKRICLVFSFILFGLLSSLTSRAAELSVLTRSIEGKFIADAVVSLVPLDTPAPTESAIPSAQIAQSGQEYSQYVTVVQAGAKVSFPNRDNVQHHVYSISKTKKFELPLYNPGQTESLVFDVSGVVTLGCNIHDWMIAYLLVVPTPYFAKTESDGTARVTAPAGRYRLDLWHPLLAKTITEEITLTDGTATPKEFSLKLKPDRRIGRGPAVRGGGY